MRVKVINKINAYDATEEVNEFLSIIELNCSVIKIEYLIANTGSTAWNCVMITYKEKT